MIHDVGWAAGFFEGEGNIRLNLQTTNGKRHGTLRLTLAQVPREPLDVFKSVFNQGSVTGPYGPYTTTRQAHYQYSVSGEKAVEIADKMRPYLLHKGLQVDSAIQSYREFLLDR